MLSGLMREKCLADFMSWNTLLNISNSLDKFYELQDFRADFYIIADESRRRQFDSLMERSMYSRIVKYVKFFNYDNLAMQYERECSLAGMDRL